MPPTVQLTFGIVLIAAPTVYVGVAVWRLVRFSNRYPEGRAGYNQARREADDDPKWLNQYWLGARVGLPVASLIFGILEVKEALGRF